jgi:hypothetical protein
MTAVAVETHYPTEERIRFVGQKLAKRMKDGGMTYGLLADDWGVSVGTVRNAFYWPTPKTVPPADRIEATEKALDLPPDTLLDQYYVERINPAYWNGEPEPEPEQPTKPGRKKTSAALSMAPPPKAQPVIVVPPVPEDALASPLRRRLMQLEHVLVGLAPLIADAAGVDADQLIADMGIKD